MLLSMYAFKEKKKKKITLTFVAAKFSTFLLAEKIIYSFYLV